MKLPLRLSRERAFAVLGAALAAVHLLGELGARAGGMTFPRFEPEWLLGLAVLALFGSPRPSKRWREFQAIALLALLGVSIWLVPRLARRFAGLPSPVLATLMETGSELERPIVLHTLGFESRRMLNRLTGSRRNVMLEIPAWIHAPRSGTYELHVSCDDGCRLDVDGARLLDERDRAVVRVELERGLHEVRIGYAQRSGPAELRLSWDRPGLFELLPLSQFISGRPEHVSSQAVRNRHLAAGALWAGSLTVFFLLFYSWASAAPAIRIALQRWLQPFWAEAMSARRKPEPLRRRDVVSFLAVFAAAFFVRLVVLTAQDQPILFGHPYNYYFNALRILEHPDTWSYLLRSDQWHTWVGWTVAPLYYLFLATVFDGIGPDLSVLRFVHALLDASVAGCIAILGSRFAGRWGIAAGLAYAVYWPAIEILNWTLTENLHTALFLAGAVLSIREAEAPGRGRAFGAGFVLGLSAMTRAVSSAFLGVLFLWRLSIQGLSGRAMRRNGLFALLLVLGGASAILPWTARNVWIVGDPVLIESVSFFNLYNDNEPRAEKTAILSELSPGPQRRAAAATIAFRGIVERPDHFVQKVSANFWHLFRPDGLHQWLVAEYPEAPGRTAAFILLGDLPLALSVALFVPFLIAGPPSPARRFTLLWVAYYLFIVVVVFHNELRYRSVLVPFLFAGAAGGLRSLVSAKRRRRAYAALVAGALLSGATLNPYVLPVAKIAQAAVELRGLEAMVAREEIEESKRLVDRVAAKGAPSSKPFFWHGRWLARYRHPEQAIASYRKGEAKTPLPWVPSVVMPQLLREAGKPAEAEKATRTANLLSWYVDPWLMLEIAWRELPPPVADTIDLARGDYGAVRGFMHPRGVPETDAIEAGNWLFQKFDPERKPPGAHRWSRGVAWLRLVPTRRSTSHLVAIEMGSPYPSPLTSPRVRVTMEDGSSEEVVLDRKIRPYRFRVETEPGAPIRVRIDAPVWSRAGEPASQGIRVDRVTVISGTNARFSGFR